MNQIRYGFYRVGSVIEVVREQGSLPICDIHFDEMEEWRCYFASNVFISIPLLNCISTFTASYDDPDDEGLGDVTWFDVEETVFAGDYINN